MSRLQDLKMALQTPDTKSEDRQDIIRRSVYEQVDVTQTALEKAASSVAVPVEKTKDTVPGTTQGINSLLSYYIRVAGSFSRLNGEMLTKNVLLVIHGLPEDVRKLSFDSFLWMADHFGDVISALILNHKNVRELFALVLAKELAAQQADDFTRKQLHESDGISFDLTDHVLELGLTEFTMDTQLLLADRMAKSISVLDDTELSKAVDRVLSSYIQVDSDDMGAILSNPVYLLIAMNYNQDFMKKLEAILTDMKAVFCAVK